MKKYKQPYSIRNDFKKLGIMVNEALLEVLIEKEHNKQKHSLNQNEHKHRFNIVPEHFDVCSYLRECYEGGLER